MLFDEYDQYFMQRALQLAASRRGFCAPNPAVGAVVVKDGKIIGEGAHWACGQAHAEAAALRPLGEAAAGARLYVTLEPCSHHGRTPPCTDLIIRKGIREVIYGMRDPNPRVPGQGAQILQRAGVNCRQLSVPEIDDFYQSYRYWLNKRLPWVTLKLAMSLDGKIAGTEGQPVALTGSECQRLTHQHRLKSDAILTTVKTILADDPQLNVRLDGETIAKPLYILDSQLRLPLTATVFRTAQSLTVFHSATASPAKQAQLQSADVRCLAVESTDQGLLLPEILTLIGADGCHDLWVEAGGRCFNSFLSQDLAQQTLIYLAPKILGANALAAFEKPFHWNRTVTWTSCGDDALAHL